MNFSEKKDAILNALIERKGLQYIVDQAAGIVGNPLFVYDISGKILAKSRRTGDEFVWSSLLPNGYLEFANIQTVERAGIYHQLLHRDEPIFGTFDFYPHRFLGCGIRDRASTVGVATIVEINDFHEDDPELLKIICKAMLFEFLYHERTSMQTIPYYSLFKDIIEESAEKAEVGERIRSLRLNIPNHIRLIGIGHPSYQNNFSIYFSREMLMTSLPACYCIIYENMMLVVLDDKYCTQTTLDVVKSCFRQLNVWVGISSVFEDVMEMSAAYKQIQAIQKVRQKLDMRENIVFYEDIFLYHFFEIASRENDLESFCMPVVGMLEDYDSKNGTLLKQSLEAYLESGRNIQKAAKKINTHKNTLYYRLQRIEELFGLDLSDENVCFNLQFSFRILRMVR